MKRAICIGLNYVGSPYQLGGCVHDAEMLAIRIQDKGANVNLVRDSITASEFYELLDMMRDVMKKSDTLYITYSGHGTQYYENGKVSEGLCMWNGTDIEVLPDVDLNAAIDRLPGTVVLILDSCFSGGMERSVAAPSKKQERFIPFNPDTMKVFKAPSERSVSKPAVTKRVNLFACKDSEVSWDLGPAGGLFTSSFLKCYDAGSRTIGKLMQKAYNLCKPDQHPTWSYRETSGNKRLF